MIDDLSASERLALAVREERRCARPVTVQMPDGTEQQVRCGSRLRDQCVSCSKLVVGDWAAILRSGVFAAPGASVFYMVTLTAPSFGRVHRVPRTSGSPNRRCSCGVVHQSDVDSHLRGVPVDLDGYDYDGTVRWNRDSSRLWDRTRSRLRVLMPRMQFASVREWQARGALHHHVLIRVPASEAAPREKLRGVLASVVATGYEGTRVRWGNQVDVRRLTPDGDAAKAIWYVTKALSYLGKAVADGSAANVPWQLTARLSRAASLMPCPTCLSRSRGRGTSEARPGCPLPAHRRQGAASAVVTVSRPTTDAETGETSPGWSLTGLTRTAQRAARAAWALRQRFTALPVETTSIATLATTSESIGNSISTWQALQPPRTGPPALP
ncbi:replication initiator [Georgenia wutianyii]|uniref:replication initiator n=1 Tax=Georgenia wutianyii TaxID=2585135 RepID=UPI0038B3BDFF